MGNQCGMGIYAETCSKASRYRRMNFAARFSASLSYTSLSCLHMVQLRSQQGGIRLCHQTSTIVPSHTIHPMSVASAAGYALHLRMTQFNIARVHLALTTLSAAASVSRITPRRFVSSLSDALRCSCDCPPLP